MKDKNKEDKIKINPLVNLPTSIDEIINNAVAVIVTHLSPDHYDNAAKKVLLKYVKTVV
ncbi:hypothetical protein [Cytobacillus praedii]|uniref:hypothetical protein n=1 Tax=Cytobacillus praedii TaxID=1742358 RepID=UPI002E1D885B|nr:hypothetical protein [Cytobacillus praedii]